MAGLIRFRPLGAAAALGASPAVIARALNGAAPADFDRAFDEITTQLFGDATQNSQSANALRADVVETDAQYIVRFDVPGVAKENINVTVEEKLVKVDVKFAAATNDGEKVLRNERLSGDVTRSFRFATPIDADSASAAHEHGVLTLTLPKKIVNTQKRLTIN